MMTSGSCFQSLLRHQLPLLNSLHSAGRASCALPQGRANSRTGIPNLSQLEDTTAGCCLPGKTGAGCGMLSLILRNKQPGLYHQGKGSSRAAAQADKPRGICRRDPALTENGILTFSMTEQDTPEFSNVNT